MQVSKWLRRSKGNAEVTIDSIRDNLGKCPTGASLILAGDQHNARIRIVPSDQLKAGALGQITVEEGKVDIVISDGQTTHTMVTSLAHELQHLSQIDSAQYLTATPDNETDFIANGLRNEAKAETSANQVAYELRQRGVEGPAREKDRDRDIDPQWTLYSSLRQSGWPHEFAAEQSEPLWHASTGRLEGYTKIIQKEWVEANEGDRFLKEHKTASQPASQLLTAAERRAVLLERATCHKGVDKDPTPEVRRTRPRGRSR